MSKYLLKNSCNPNFINAEYLILQEERERKGDLNLQGSTRNLIP